MLAVLALVCGLLIAGCPQEPYAFPETKTNPTEAALSRHDYLALLKTQNTHQVSLEELQGIVTKVLETSQEGRFIASGGSAITGVKKLPVSGSQSFITYSKGAGRSAVAQPETEPVEIYELSIEQPNSDTGAFVLASNDIRIGNILAIAEGSLENAPPDFVEVLNANLHDYIDSTIAEYNSISEAEIEAALAKAIAQDEEARTLYGHWSGHGTYNWKSMGCSYNLKDTKGPLLTTKWGQGSTGTYSPTDYAYNNYIKYVHANDTHVTGCVPTAIAQILAFYGNYGNYNIQKAPIPPAFDIPGVGQWSGKYNIGLISGMQKITNESSATAKGQVAALMYQLGKICGAKDEDYTDKGTSITTNGIINGFKSMGYGVVDYSGVTSLSDTTNSSTSSAYGHINGTLTTGIDHPEGERTESFYDGSTVTYRKTTSTQIITDAIGERRPVLICGSIENSNLGHAWVIDGCGTMTTYREYFVDCITGLYNVITFNLTNCLMVHCNLGWDGAADGWYIYGLFDTKNRLRIEDSPDPSDGQNFSAYTLIIVPQRPANPTYYN
jgi:hypothetical protein